MKTLLLSFLLFILCNNKPTKVNTNISLENYSTAYFAAGCFWCVEAIFESVNGVIEAESGYAGGKMKNPTYPLVSAGKTNHAEAVKVYYDSSIVSYSTLVQVFFGSQDPTTLNRQGPDVGKQYRSIAFYQNKIEREIISNYIIKLNDSGKYTKPIITEIKAFDIFYIAEDYHQDYEKINPQNPYVQAVSIPRLNKFKKQYPTLLK